MEGVLYFKHGMVKAQWHKYYAHLDEEKQIFVLLKKSYKG